MFNNHYNLRNVVEALHENISTYGMTPAMQSFLDCESTLGDLLKDKSDDECLVTLEGFWERLMDSFAKQWTRKKTKKKEKHIFIPEHIKLMMFHD